jgi:hypothetical protein
LSFDKLSQCNKHGNVSLHSDICRAVNSADLIVVETSVNDVEEGEKNIKPGENSQLILERYTEILIRQLLSLSNNTISGQSAGLIWLGASTRGGPRPLQQWLLSDRDSDATRQQLTVTTRYNFSHVSFIDGFGPLTGQAKEDWFFNTFRSDR